MSVHQSHDLDHLPAGAAGRRKNLTLGGIIVVAMEGVPDVGDMSIHRDGGAPLGPREDRQAVRRDDWAVGAIILVERVLQRPNAKRPLSSKQVILRLRCLEYAAEMEKE